jgi:hypothetical protein
MRLYFNNFSWHSHECMKDKIKTKRLKYQNLCYGAMLSLWMVFLLTLVRHVYAEEEFFINDVPFHCINEAAMRYYVPTTLLISILITENGRRGAANLNKNGTYDYGPMQINSCWLPRIARFGYTREKLQFDPCANVEVGAWILSQALANGHDIWNGVGNYHSYTKHENAKYASHVQKRYKVLIDYLR